MFKENKEYNKIIDRQLKEYTHNKEVIQNRVINLLNDCNVHYIIGNETDRDKKIKQLGADNIVSIGGGGFIFRSKLNKFNCGMKIISILKDRNIRLNIYGGLYYELNNFEYCMGLTPLRDILRDIGVKHSISTDDTFMFDECYHIRPEIFNYVVDLYKSNHSDYY